METVVLCVTFLISCNYTVQDRGFNAHLSTSSERRRLSKRVAGTLFSSLSPSSRTVRIAPFETGSPVLRFLCSSVFSYSARVLLTRTFNRNVDDPWLSLIRDINFVPFSKRERERESICPPRRRLTRIVVRKNASRKFLGTINARRIWLPD